MKKEKIKAFCVDFNWDDFTRFASPGLYAHADPKVHLQWYKELGVNTIQSFFVSHNGYAWYDSDIFPRTPGMTSNFMQTLTQLGHDEGMRVMGYFSPGANAHWRMIQPAYSHDFRANRWHIPFTTKYLDYLCRGIEEALVRVPVDGFMIDWLWNVDPVWMPCEIEMYEELMGEAFPGIGEVQDDLLEAFHRRAIERAWKRIRETAKSVREDCIIWLSCNDLNHPQIKNTVIPSQIDWLMNEHPDPERLKTVKGIIGENTQIIQCVCGWGNEHDAEAIFNNPLYADIGIYGFAKPDPYATLPVNDGGGNYRNVEVIREAFRRQ